MENENGLFLSILLIVICAICSTVQVDIPGHLKPLGHHRKPEGGIQVLTDFPLPTDFYNNYVLKSQPFIVKGVLDRVDFPAYKLWNDGYLNDKYGDLQVEVEGGKKENRNAPAYLMPLSNFLQIYNQSNIYLVQDVAVEMKADISIPVSLQCGGLQDVIKSVIVWFSSGGTKSVLHKDGLDNINCLLNGKKDLIMINKKYKPEIEDAHFIQVGSYSKVDVESVDMEKFPKFRDLPWYLVNITKGDCLYIPYHWYHHVYSHPGRNLAVNIWSNHLRWFNETDCKEVEPNLKQKLLKDLEVKDDEVVAEADFRQALLELFGDADVISSTEFVHTIKANADQEISDELLAEVFEVFDKDRDHVISMYEFHVVDVPAILEIIADIDLFGKIPEDSPELQPGGYYNREPMVLTKDDDYSFLIKSHKPEKQKEEL